MRSVDVKSYTEEHILILMKKNKKENPKFEAGNQVRISR